MADFDDIIDTLIAEAGGQGPEGMRRVAETILNRSAIRNQSPHQVVTAPHQYTGYFAPGPKAREAQRDANMRAKAEDAWRAALGPEDPTGGADHYKTTAVHPSWASKMPEVSRYGVHQFYKSAAVPQKALSDVSAMFAPQAQPVRPLPAAQGQQARAAAGRTQSAYDSLLNDTFSELSKFDKVIEGSFAELGIRPTPQSVASLSRMIVDTPQTLPEAETNLFAGGAGSLTPAFSGGGARKPPAVRRVQTVSVTPKTAAPKSVAPAPQLQVERDLGSMPGFAALADMFGARLPGPNAKPKSQERLFASSPGMEFDPSIDTAENWNPFGVDVDQMLTPPAVQVAANGPRPMERLGRPQVAPSPQGPLNHSTPPATPAASAALAFQPEPRPRAAVSAIAKAFEPASALRVATNGYAYMADGNGGYAQAGTTRPAGMSPQEHYESINRQSRERAESRSSSGRSSSGRIYDRDSNSWRW